MTKHRERLLDRWVTLLANGSTHRAAEEKTKTCRSTMKVHFVKAKPSKNKEYLKELLRYIAKEKPKYKTLLNKYGPKAAATLWYKSSIEKTSSLSKRAEVIDTYRKNNISFKEIGKKLRLPESVVSWTHRTHYSVQKNIKVEQGKEIDKEILRAHNAGLSIRETADKLSRSEQRVRQALRDYGVKRIPKISMEDTKNIMMLRKKLTWAELSVIYNVSPSNLQHHCTKALREEKTKSATCGISHRKRGGE